MTVPSHQVNGVVRTVQETSLRVLEMQQFNTEPLFPSTGPATSKQDKQYNLPCSCKMAAHRSDDPIRCQCSRTTPSMSTALDISTSPNFLLWIYRY